LSLKTLRAMPIEVLNGMRLAGESLCSQVPSSFYGPCCSSGSG